MTVIHRIVHAPAAARHARSSLSTPMLASDQMPAVRSMLDGRLYDSKSALRASYRAAGVTEVGNDPSIRRHAQKPMPDRKAIRATVARAFARMGLG